MPTLSWVGKDKVINHHHDVPFRVLKTDRTFQAPEGTPANSTDNRIIHGDNLEALKSLLPEFEGRVKCIYIDPPYNTGFEGWIYNDAVNDPKMAKWLGQVVGKEGEDLSRHDKWLCMMYPRLMLLKKLLSKDGVLFVSINDENRAKLELLLDEVMAGMRVGSLVWRTKDTGNDGGRRFSHVHEHVLVYANREFKFHGRPTDQSKFRNPDKDPRGDWAPRPLTKAHSASKRPNTYYPIQDPATGYWYPCDPNRVWAYATETRVTESQKLRSDTMEELIRKDLIYFPPCKPERVMLFDTREALLTAIREGRGPVLPKKKTPLLREDLPDLDFWIGKPIAPDRPSLKDHWMNRPESERIAPLGSWIAGLKEAVEFNEDDEDALPEILRSTRGGVATDEVSDVLGAKVFDNPKPLSLLMGLLSQSTSGDDLILDSFAGSGTTAHAILKLNAQDGGRRRFILVEMEEYVERVTAERVRGAITGYGVGDKKVEGLGGGFDYCTVGEPLFLDEDNLNEAVGIQAIRDYVAYSEGIPEEDRQTPENPHTPYLLGLNRDFGWVFYYEPDQATSLDLDFLGGLRFGGDTGAPKPPNTVIYADRCLLPKEFLTKHGIIFKKIPRDISRF